MNYRKKGFTLVELLVVIAIIGILIGLLLPAVQAAREAARRMQCTNNLKQFGIAAQNFHDVQGFLPSASAQRIFEKFSSNNGNWKRFSGLVAMLPYLEQSALYDIAISDIEDGASPWTRSSSRAVCKNVTAFLCPSDGNGRKSGDDTTGRTNYRLSRGDISLNWDWDEARSPFGNGQKRAISLSSITDGTSNTIFFSEAAVGSSGKSRDVRAGVVFLKGNYNNGHTSGWGNFYFTPSVCAAARGANGQISSSYDVATNGENDHKGCRWGDAQDLFTIFWTMLPPNSPTCSRNDIENDPRVSASSYHSGGVNTCFGDGSVRFISDTVDCGDQSDDGYSKFPSGRPQDYSGPSIYGVWGALGTMEGGETASL